jgi:hypothetical protein
LLIHHHHHIPLLHSVNQGAPYLKKRVHSNGLVMTEQWIVTGQLKPTNLCPKGNLKTTLRTSRW